MKKQIILFALLFFFSFIIQTKGQTCQASFYYWEDTIPNSIVFYDASTSATSWQWDFGDSTISSLQNPNHTYSASGIYHVCLTIFDSVQSCTSTFCDNVYVGSCFAYFSYFPDIIPNSMQFYNQSYGNMTSIVWDFDDGTQSSDLNPFHVYSHQGTYYVCLTISDTTQMCISTFCDSLYVGNNPNVRFSVCDGFWSDSSTWLNGQVPHQTDSVIIKHNVIMDTNTIVIPPGLLVIDSTGELCGHYDLHACFITFGPMQVNNLISEGDCVNNAYVGTEGDYTGNTGSWTQNANVCFGCPSICNPIIPCCAAHFIVYPDTIPHNWIAVNQATGVAPLSYLWNWGDSTTSTGPTPSHIYSNPGFYNICLTINDAVGCSRTYCDSSTNISHITDPMITINVVFLPTAIMEQIEADKSIIIYPNPVTDNLQIQTASQIKNVEITDIAGRLLYSTNYKTINCSGFAQGVYYIRVTSEKGIAVKKFVKE
jgi:PKD repeat protein